MTTEVIKTTAELYQVRGESSWDGWGDIFLICGEESVRVVIDSEYGNYSHYWSRCGGNPKEFLMEIDFDCCLKKLTHYKHYIPDPAEYPQEVKRAIIESRREGLLEKDEAREAWGDMLNTENCKGDLYFKELIDHRLFEPVFGSVDSLPRAKKIDPRCQDFWDKVWLPFVAQLKQELA